MQHLLNCVLSKANNWIQVFSAKKPHNMHLDVYRALALNALAFALYFIALCIFALDKKQLRGCCIEVRRCNILGYVLLFDITKHYGA